MRPSRLFFTISEKPLKQNIWNVIQGFLGPITKILKLSRGTHKGARVCRSNGMVSPCR